VDSSPFRPRSALEILPKLVEAGVRIQKAVTKAVLSCGCIRLAASKPSLPENATLTDLRHLLSRHVEGSLCESCRETLEEEMGRNIYYLAALCNTLDLHLFDVLLKEHKKVSLLGIYGVS
jgi:hypothetical protein